jgi:hypothetical protein
VRELQLSEEASRKVAGDHRRELGTLHTEMQDLRIKLLTAEQRVTVRLERLFRDDLGLHDCVCFADSAE